MGSFFSSVFKAVGLAPSKKPAPIPPPPPEDAKQDKGFDPNFSKAVAAARSSRLQLRTRRGRGGLRTDLSSGKGAGISTAAR